MTQTYYLKATSEAALWTALGAVGLAHKEYDPDDPLNVAPADLGYDETWEPTGAYEWQADTQMLDVIGPIYHANLRESLTDAQVAALPTVATPTTPYRVWAGDNT